MCLKLLDIDKNKCGESVNCGIMVWLLCSLAEANDEEMSAVAEQVEQQHARVGEDSVMAVALDVKENDLPDDEEKLAGSVGVEEEIDLQADDSDGAW